MPNSNPTRSHARAAVTAAAFLVTVVAVFNCTSDRSLVSGPQFHEAGVPARATGTVEIIWPGGRGREIPPGEEKLAFAEITIFDATDASPARGRFVYRVLNADSTLHREIVAEIADAVVEFDAAAVASKAWAIGLVVSHVKTCSGSGACDGHDGGEEGGCSGDTGGCSGEDDTTHDGGGCSGGGDMGGGDVGGGCSGEEGGCTGGGGDMGGGDMGGGDMGGGDMGAGCGSGGETDGCSGDGHTGGVGGVPGNEPRIGQIVAIKLHDRGTPAFTDDGDDSNDDGVTWKWFLAETAPTIDTYASWSHLCKKTIIGGNLTVLPARQ